MCCYHEVLLFAYEPFISPTWCSIASVISEGIAGIRASLYSAKYLGGWQWEAAC